MDPTAAQPLSAVVFHVLLALDDGHGHGYAIGKAIEEASGMRLGPGTLYGALQRMERDGLVEELDSDGSRRKPFGLTQHGRRALVAEAQRLAHLAALARARNLIPETDPI